MKLTQNQYWGLESERPHDLTPGSIYVAVDSKKIYVYYEESEPEEFGGGSGSSVTVVDSLASSSSTDALSANQGNQLNLIKINKPVGQTPGFMTVVDATGNDVEYIAVPVVVDEVITVTSASIGSAAPVGAQSGVDPSNGQQFYVDGSGNWQAVPVASLDLNSTVSNETGSNGTGLTTPSTPPASNPTPDVGDIHIEVYDDVTLYFTATAANWTAPGVIEVNREISIMTGTNDIVVGQSGLVPVAPIGSLNKQLLGSGDFGEAISPWVTGKSYTLGNTVHESNIIYLCTSSHISSPVFATDSANWQSLGVDNFATADLSSTGNRIHTFDDVMQIIGEGQKDIVSSDGAGRTSFFRVNQGTADIYVSNSTGANNSLTGIQIFNSNGTSARVEVKAVDPVTGTTSAIVPTGDELRVFTPEVDAGNATVGQVLKLKQTNGDAEWANVEYSQDIVVGDWTADGLGNASITVTAAVHGLGVNPTAFVYSVSGLVSTLEGVDVAFVSSSGDITLTIAEEDVFNGKIILK